MTQEQLKNPGREYATRQYTNRFGDSRDKSFVRIPDEDRLGQIKLSRTGKSIIIDMGVVGYVSLASLDRVLKADSPYAVIKRPKTFEE